MVNEFYNLEGTIDINGNRKDKPYLNKNTWPSYQEDYIKFKNYIIHCNKNNIGSVLLRVYDGEFWFLKQKKVGNVGRRHVSKKLTPEFIKPFYDNCLKVDKFMSHLTIFKYGGMHNLYKSVFGNKQIDYPMEFAYAIVMNKWIFNTFKNQIGLIGGTEKIKVIKELMKRKQYQDYLGIDYFTDYISVPERYACDNHTKLSYQIENELKNATAKIFLFGIGISKLAIAYKFKEYYNAVYIDVGNGLSAIAGNTTKIRPYAGGWTNYRIKKYDYSKMDPMDFTKNENIILID